MDAPAESHSPAPTFPAGLTVSGLRLTRDGRAILRDVSFSAPKGRVSVVVAPSGTGKSTLLRCLNRLLEPDAGEIRLDGVDIRSLEPRVLRRRVGLIGQLPVMLPGSVRDNLSHGLPALTDPDADTALGDAGLDASFRDRPAQDLSGGERARVALARALVRRPEMLVLDEPTAALDAAMAVRIGQTLRRLAGDGYGVILASHDLPFVADIADQVIALSAGGARVGSAAEMLGARPA